MKVTQARWEQGAGWSAPLEGPARNPQLVFLFGAARELGASGPVEDVRRAWPEAQIVGCSTAGEICDTEITDDALVATAIEFEHTEVRIVREPLGEGGSHACGVSLGRRMVRDGLRHVFVLSDGLAVNGSDLVTGLTSVLPDDVTLTGGLSGDGERFQETFVLSESGVETATVVAVGLYGEHLDVGYASLGGWDPFGPERLVTRSEGNVLYELDGKSALELYKSYLGDHAGDLPASGLLFPLVLRRGDEEPVVRTILGVDEEQQSMTFAGDVPEGMYARLARASFDRLIDGAADAARWCTDKGAAAPDLAILISCVGRKIVLKQRTEEELEAIRDVLGDKPVLSGFYSYGEISPFTKDTRCELHNQTMSITTLSER